MDAKKITHPIVSIYVDQKNSSIKFGSWDQIGIENEQSLTMFRFTSNNLDSETAQASHTKLSKVLFWMRGANLSTKAQDVRYAMFKPELKYIIAPLEDW